MDFILRPDSHLHSSMSVLLARLDYINSFAHFLQLLSLSSKLIFNLVFRRKNPVVGMMKMASWRLPKGYPFCTNNSYSFQDRKLLFCRSIIHISYMCITPAIKFGHLLAKYFVLRIPFPWKRSVLSVQG